VWLVTADGELVGYAAVRSTLPAQMFAFVGVLPEHRGAGLGTELIRLVEERALERAPEAGPGDEVVLDQNVGQHNPGAAGLLEEHGYRFVRRFLEMRLRLDGSLPAPEWPDGFELDSFVPGEERAVFDLMTDAFSEHWGFVEGFPFEEWRTWMVEREQFDPSLWFLARAGDELAGGSLCLVREDGAGWVNVLGVRTQYRGRGVGLALLRHSFCEFRRRGFTQAGLDVDSENPSGATRLYERSGLRVTRHSDAYRKVLRAGG
jgi:mycothiol synthase